jgi:hypothetical protein
MQLTKFGNKLKMYFFLYLISTDTIVTYYERKHLSSNFFNNKFFKVLMFSLYLVYDIKIIYNIFEKNNSINIFVILCIIAMVLFLMNILYDNRYLKITEYVIKFYKINTLRIGIILLLIRVVLIFDFF